MAKLKDINPTITYTLNMKILHRQFKRLERKIKRIKINPISLWTAIKFRIAGFNDDYIEDLEKTFVDTKPKRKKKNK